MKQEEGIILTRLLDKYENSKHLLEPGKSNRRVMLRIDKKELPEYRYQEAAVRDAYNQAAQELEKEQLVTLEWVADRPVLSAIILHLDRVCACYHLVGRKHPREQAALVVQTIEEALSCASTPWIAAWRDEVCARARSAFAVPTYCKTETAFLSKLLTAFSVLDSLHGDSITMRAFSGKCYHDSKYFEREIRDEFLRIAQKYCPGLSDLCEQEEISVRDKLAYLGIYARPEIYELSGNFSFSTAKGRVDANALMPYGIALPSTAVDAIASLDLKHIEKIVFIENKTNYDEYLLSEMSGHELVIYHGGFLSPQKRKLISKIARANLKGMPVYFWADIDLGGFEMFSQLQSLIPDLQPMRMAEEDVLAFHEMGLPRSTEYLKKAAQTLEVSEYPLFEKAIERILEYGVTIEQEVFLSTRETKLSEGNKQL